VLWQGGLSLIRGLPFTSGGASCFLSSIDEVGNPAILATLAVVAAILPMAFVRGLSGPSLRPILVGASAAMVFSLVVAFVVTPWAAVRLLEPSAHHDHGEEDLLTRLYRRVMGPLITSGRRRAIFLAGVAALLLAAAALVPLELVRLKMMPFDNTSGFQVMIDMPEGTALELARRVRERLVPIAKQFGATHPGGGSATGPARAANSRRGSL
jgi:multidrug efflux pump subunit AcrB